MPANPMSYTATQTLWAAPRFWSAHGCPSGSSSNTWKGARGWTNFFRQFPSVTRHEALAALDLARDSLLAKVRSDEREPAGRGDVGTGRL